MSAYRHGIRLEPRHYVFVSASLSLPWRLASVGSPCSMARTASVRLPGSTTTSSGRARQQPLHDHPGAAELGVANAVEDCGRLHIAARQTLQRRDIHARIGLLVVRLRGRGREDVVEARERGWLVFVRSAAGCLCQCVWGRRSNSTRWRLNRSQQRCVLAAVYPVHFWCTILESDTMLDSRSLQSGMRCVTDYADHTSAW